MKQIESREWASADEEGQLDRTKAQRSRRRKAGSSHRHGDRTAWESASGRAGVTVTADSMLSRRKASGRWQRTEGNAECRQGRAEREDAMMGVGGEHTEERERAGRPAREAALCWVLDLLDIRSLQRAAPMSAHACTCLPGSCR